MRRALEERPSKTLLEVLDRLLLVCHFALNGVIRWVPLAVFGVVLESTLKNGLAPVGGLSAYLGVALAGLLAQNLFVYLPWIKFKGRIGIRRFWTEAKEPVVYALGANSSLATLPLTLKALDRLKIGKEAQALGACVATNINQDGILLYEAMAVLFVAQYYGVNLSLPEQLLAGLSCVLAAMGVAGVPEAGLISLALVLTTVGLPTEVLPLLLSVDWIVARARSATNVMSDLTLAILVEEDKNRS
jgi:DAACS family dicarboxylate/amino acid:cation (Na+ or H+) symporter